MSDYTDEEIEALIGAVMASASDVERSSPLLRSQVAETVRMLLDGRIYSVAPRSYDLSIPEVASLMRDAYERGARDMRERAAIEIESWSEGDVARAVRALPLRGPQ